MKTYREDVPTHRTDVIIELTPQEHEALRLVLLDEVLRSGAEHRDPPGQTCRIEQVILGSTHGVHRFEVRVRGD